MNTTEKSCPACCQIRSAAPTEKINEEKFEEKTEIRSPVWEFVLPIVSGLALVASFFHWIPGFDPAWIAIVVSGTPLFRQALNELFDGGRISADFLVSTAILATIVANGYFPAHHGEHSYLFAGGEVAFIMQLGLMLENWTVRRARAGIESLLRLTPRTARRISDFGEEVLPISQILSGDQLRVLPGETVPVDGKIESGNTSIDQSLMTGESMPLDKSPGDAVFGGTINCFGSFTMRATNVGEDSSLARMIRLVQEAEQRRAPLERIIDRWASFLVPIAILTAILVGFGTWWLTGRLEDGIMRGVTILVVFCPCSLVLATPTAIIAAIGNASRHGILIRSGETLERLGSVDVLAFDKTGTLTIGEPKLKFVQSFVKDYDENGLLALAASAETLSEHPLSRCIVETAAERGLSLSPTADFRMFPGQGIVVRIADSFQGEVATIGNDRLMERFGIGIDEVYKKATDTRFNLGETVLWFALDQRLIGFLSLADTIRETTKKTVERIREIGVDVLLLTGDNERAAQSIAEQSGIHLVRPNLLPEGKVEALEEFKQRGTRIGMVGDGLNDAPALKTANVGVAMGKVGSDLTIDAADVVLVGDDISRIPFLIRLSRKTKQTIFNNIVLSMSINVVAILLASLGVMGPVVGALVHNAGSVFVVLNASLLLNIKREE